MPNRTPLYEWHVARGARMVDFAGWDMPIQYKSIVDEHNTVRNAAGLFDISHMGRLSFSGDDALALIQRVFTNNAATMKEMQVRYGLICNDEGGIRDDVLVYRWPEGYAMVVNASNREKILQWLADSKGDLKAEVEDRTLTTCMIAVQGPKAVSMCKGLTDADSEALSYYYGTPAKYQGKPCLVSRTGYTGEDGIEIIVDGEQGTQLWEELLDRGALPCGLGARDTLRLEAAMPLYGHELSEEIDPFQAGVAWAVKMKKGDFRGREALERRRQDASLQQRVGLELDGKRIAREGSKLMQAGKEVGLVTSGTSSPTLQKSIAMGYVDSKMTQLGTVVTIDIRGKEENARIVEMPFYKRRTT